MIRTKSNYLWHVLRAEADSDKPEAGADAPPQETVGTNNDARLKLLSDINDQNDVARADEFNDVHDDDTVTPFEAPKIGVADPEEKQVEKEKPEEEPTEPKRYKLTVNGTERDVTIEEALALAQKVAAADEYLDQARAAKKAALAEKDPPLPDPQPTQEEVKQRKRDEDLALVRAIKTGSEEEAVAAVEKIRAPVNLDDIGRTIDERLAFSSALEWFNDEYDDLITDKQLHQIVLSRDDEMVRSGDKRSYKERYKAIGDEVRTWRDQLVKQHAATHPAEDGALKEKEDAKRVAPKVPTPAAAKNKPVKDEDEKEESPSEIIAKMQQHRGGPQWMRG